MPQPPIFKITYWGVTGTLTAPLRPPEVTEKIVAAVCRLIDKQKLERLRSGPGLERAVREAVDEGLTFAERSTYGGNTTCVEVQTPDATLILDCGSGLRELGMDLRRRWNAPDYDGARTAHVLMTHPHLDHILAIPYAGPFYDPRNHFTLWGTRSVLESLAAVLSPVSPLSHTYFPPSFDLMTALKDIRELKAGEDFHIGSTRIRTQQLNHPGGCLAYRLENSGRVFVFATDHEHPEIPDAGLAEFARGADVFYTDGQYLLIEYEGREGLRGEGPIDHRGWGHSTVEGCVSTAVAAGVRELHLGHRDPTRTDKSLEEIENYLQKCLEEQLHLAGRAGTCQALIPYEGMTFRL
jgi:phosphoribosyl 1,2-cyclic phosphodiesterase